MENLAKIFPQWFGNPNWIYIPLGLIGLVVLYFVFKEQGKMSMKVWYFAPIERLITKLDVNELTPKSVKTENDFVFMRRAFSWLYKEGARNTVIFLATVGKGITYALEGTPKKKAEKVGTLYDGVESCLGETDIKTLSEVVTNKLKESNIYVGVTLESGEDLPEISEEGALKEANQNMAELVGKKIKDQMQKEDWIRNAGLIGIGIAATFAAQALGII